MTAKVENIDLPQGVWLDPRRGKMGGQYVFVAAPSVVGKGDTFCPGIAVS